MSMRIYQRYSSELVSYDEHFHYVLALLTYDSPVHDAGLKALLLVFLKFPTEQAVYFF